MREQELTAQWASEDGRRVETLTIGWENGGWTADGRIEGTDPVHYAVRLDASWTTRQVLVFRDLDEPDLWLANDGQGGWGEVNGSYRPELRGCVDVDITLTPFTSTLPIRRIGLPVGEAIELWSVWIDPDTLTVIPAHQRYSRLAEREWRYEALLPGYRVDFEVDEHGLALDYAGAFRRVW